MVIALPSAGFISFVMWLICMLNNVHMRVCVTLYTGEAGAQGGTIYAVNTSCKLCGIFIMQP